EYPELRPVCVDLSSAGAEPDQIRHLMALLMTTDAPEAGAAQVALRPTGQYSARLQRATAQANTAPLIRPDATYLITGGLGGLGLAVADWLVASGARHLLLVGRRGPDAAVQTRLDAMTAHGVAVQVAQADVADAAQLRTALDHVAEQAPLAGVIHSVGVLDDGALPNQDWGRFAKVLAPKMQGAWNLHGLMQEKALDFVVFFSSVTSLLGNRGQANYAAANAFLDALAAYRRARGQPAVSLNWGPWAEIGVAATRTPARLTTAQTTGMGVIPPATGIAALAGLVQAAYGQVGVVPITWEQYALPAGADRVYFEALQPRKEGPSAAAQRPAPSSIRRHLESVPPAQRYAVVSQWLQTEVRTLLQLQQAPAVEIGFQDLGMDSLLSIELRRQLERGLDCTLPATIAFEYPSITDLAHYLLATVVKGEAPEIAPSSESAPAAPTWSDKQPPDATSTAVDELSDADAETRLLERLQQLGM
ncbi:MAG: SDR family NAD(P)-dependent oxidoreductase, partial [Chloroflexales bacterium]